jgi:hypothetical protein
MNQPVGAGLLYRARRNALEYETSYTLEADALSFVRGSGAAVRLPYASVREVRLFYNPTRFDRARFHCDLTLGNGLRERIPSTSYVSIGNFADHAGAYRQFVRALVERVAAANPACRFRAGRRPLVYVVEHAFLLTALLALALVIALVGGFSPSGIVATKLMVIAFYIPVAISFARRNWPRSFSPAAIPEVVLPDPPDGELTSGARQGSAA